MPAKKPTIEIPASVPMPSADLINFRFDQQDKKFDELNAKLDALTIGFLTKEEARNLKEEHDKDISALWKKFDDQRWYWRAVFTCGLTLVAGVVSVYLTKG